MAVKVQFEIGHIAKLRREKTPEGYTHDWELYVKGTDKSDISHFVDKIVFNLHDSFPKPKRTYKESPYVLKESGYAGFVVFIDIYFRNRDEPKKVTFSYDLDLQNTGPPVHRSEVKKFIFNNPSDEFRQKLLKGGGIPLLNNQDEKSRDSIIDERSLNYGGGKSTKLSNNSNNSSSNVNDKKYKLRPDDSKNQTFAALFGPPITKTTNKVSPDPNKGNKSSPNVGSLASSSSSNKGSSRAAIDKNSSSSLTFGKDKSEKVDKKDKHKHNSPHKEKIGSELKDNTKKNSMNDERNRREDKKKDKSHSKERERSKDKNSKQQQQQRPPSPPAPPPPSSSSKSRLSSPSLKRGSSPSRTSSIRGGGEENGFRQLSTTSSSKSNNNLEIQNDSKKSATASNSSNKKSKKEKKSHDKEKERDRKERDRDKKEKDDRSINSSSTKDTMMSQSTNSIGSSKTNVAESKIDLPGSKRDKESSTGGSNAVTSISSKDKKTESKLTEISGNDNKKSSDKYDKDNKDKDTEKKHKHKKKDKNKEKDKDKDKEHLPLKEKKTKDKASKLKDCDSKKQQQQQQALQTSNESAIVSSSKLSSSNPLSALMHELSDRDSSDSENGSVVPSVSEKVNNHSDSSNSSFPDVIQSTKAPSSLTSITAQANDTKETRQDKKERKVREKPVKTDKDEKKRKRKSKEDSATTTTTTVTTLTTDPLSRKSVSPSIGGSVGEPPLKQIKKDDYYMKNGERSNSPLVNFPSQISSVGSNQLQQQTATSSPRLATNDHTATFRAPSSSSSLNVNSTSGIGSGSNATSGNMGSSTSMVTSQQNDRNSTLTVDYMSELRELQQKIMTLQDNNDLQQVVEMIAATGRFEVTNKTFDFDLCALDRNTVQRLQDFFATSVS